MGAPMPDLTPVMMVTDGACSGNPGPGGWCAILRYGEHEKTLQGGASLTTNNRMELRTTIRGLQVLTRPCQVEIHTDSEYVQKGITQWLSGWLRNGWRTRENKPVKNQDLWRLLHKALQPHQVTWRWVKGHAGNALNERADQLAVAAIQKYGVNGQPDMEPAGTIPE